MRILILNALVCFINEELMMNRKIKQIGLRLLLCGVISVIFGLGNSDAQAGEPELEQATFYVY